MLIVSELEDELATVESAEHLMKDAESNMRRELQEGRRTRAPTDQHLKSELTRLRLSERKMSTDLNAMKQSEETLMKEKQLLQEEL